MKATKLPSFPLAFVCTYCLIAFVASPPVIASGGWEIIREPDLEVELQYIKFFDESRGFAYGRPGVY
ncbi:hypothetical protein ACFL6S_11010 [Candidatus Poribacteria bacterium]